LPTPTSFKANLIKSDRFSHPSKTSSLSTLGDTPPTPVKIITALSYFSGDLAQPWAENHLNLYHEGRTPFATWLEFERTVKEAFGDADEAAAAATAIEALAMGLGTCEQYTTAFETLEARCGWNDMALVHQYEKGLTKALKQKIYSINPTDFPKTLAEWKQRARAFRCSMEAAPSSRGRSEPTSSEAHGNDA
jgi:hypothetical protein